MRYVKGNLLTPEQKQQVLSMYVHRSLDITCKTDEDWLAQKSFLVTKSNQLAKNVKRCFPAFFADLKKQQPVHQNRTEE